MLCYIDIALHSWTSFFVLNACWTITINWETLIDRGCYYHVNISHLARLTISSSCILVSFPMVLWWAHMFSFSTVTYLHILSVYTFMCEEGDKTLHILNQLLLILFVVHTKMKLFAQEILFFQGIEWPKNARWRCLRDQYFIYNPDEYRYNRNFLFSSYR